MKISSIPIIAALAVAIGAVGAAIAQTNPDPVGAQRGDADSAFVDRQKFSEPTGEQMFRRVCAACHMADAKGAQGAGMYPALAKNEKLVAGGYPLYVVMKGLNGMPAMGTMMTDQQVADVVNYVRTHFGNRYRDKVTAEEAKALR